MTTATIKDRKAATKWQKTFNLKAPKVGDVAPDFSIFDIEGKNQIRSSDFRGKKPVALIFGSYT